MGFYIASFLSALVYFVLMDLSKNKFAGWLIAAGLYLILISARILLRKREHWTVKQALPVWAVFLLLLLVNLKLTEPTEALVPAVAVRHPQVTEVVTLEQGQLTGVYNADKTVKVYAGIPYAKPPVGDLRWKEPQAPEPWEGVRSCDHFAQEAYQSEEAAPLMDSLYHLLGYHDYRWLDFSDNYRIKMSEDCLYLNVYAPASAKAGDQLPVLVYIHGGSLTSGQPWYTEYRGEDMARQDIVVVNIAYRVNIFGYLALEELASESPNGTTGNYGLLDQVQSLRWIRDNIAAFGGDPDQVTICGESAGSSSINALCVSPLSEGLFRRAIAESSSVLAYQPYHTFRSYDEALETGREILKDLGASSLEDLRSMPAAQVFATKYQNSAMTVDGYAIAEQPYLTYEKGKNHEEALLNGFNAHEADVFLMDTKATAENYTELMRPILGSYAEEAARQIPAGSVAQYRPFIIDAGGEAKGALNEVYSAAWFTYSHYLWTRYLLEQGRPVYEYYFTRSNSSLGCIHAGELPYVFGNLWRHPGIYAPEDYNLSAKMQTYWVNFAKYGDPNGAPGSNTEGADNACGVSTAVLGAHRQMKDADSILPYWPRATGGTDVFELGDRIGVTQDPYLAIYQLLDRYQADLRAQAPDRE